MHMFGLSSVNMWQACLLVRGALSVLTLISAGVILLLVGRCLTVAAL